MTYLMAIAIAAGVSIGVFVIWHLARAGRVWRRVRGDRVVTCPETGHPAAVRIDAAHVALTTMTNAGGDVRLAACSRWETRGRCDEACLAEAFAPGSTVSAISLSWYADKPCVYCGEPVRDEPVVDHHAALLGPDGTTREWSEVAPERLPGALSRPYRVSSMIALTSDRQHHGEPAL